MKHEFTPGHYVAVWMQQSLLKEDTISSCPGHKEYYEQLQAPGQTVFYSHSDYSNTLFIVLAVSSDHDFDYIISNDPAVREGMLQVVSKVSFREPQWMS